MKNLATHVVSGAVILIVGVASGNAYHQQQVVAREKAHAAAVAAQKAADETKAKAEAEQKAKEAALAAQQAAAKGKSNVITPKSTTSSVSH